MEKHDEQEIYITCELTGRVHEIFICKKTCRLCLKKNNHVTQEIYSDVENTTELCKDVRRKDNKYIDNKKRTAKLKRKIY